MPDIGDRIDSASQTVGRGFGELLLDALAFIGLGLGGGQAAAAGFLQHLQQLAMQEHGDTQLPPAALAEAVVKHAVGQEWAADSARLAGMTGNVFDVMVKTTGNPPGPETLLDMLRRGFIDDATFVHGLNQGYLKDEWVDAFRRMREVLPTVGDLVAGAVQNHLPYDLAAAESRQHGVAPEWFRLMFDNAGNPPGPTQLLDLWRRGDITEADVNQGLRESRLKDKWIGPLKNLAIRKIPLRTITTLLTHQAIDDGTAVKHLRELGYTADDAAALVKAAHFQKAATSKELTVAQVRDLYQEHAITRDQAVTDLQQIGYPANIADQIMALADINIRNATKRAAIGKVRAAYDRRAIDRTGASNELDALAVPSDQRDALLGLWDVEREVNVRQLSPTDITAAGHLGLLQPGEVLDRLRALGFSDGDARLFAFVHHGIDLPGQPA